MPTSVLDAIKLGWWDFEPDDLPTNDFDPTEALPGSQEKIDVLAEPPVADCPYGIVAIVAIAKV